MNEKFFYNPNLILTDKWKENPYNHDDWYKFHTNKDGLMRTRVTKNPGRSDEWDEDGGGHLWSTIGDFIHDGRDERQVVDFLNDPIRRGKPLIL